MFVDHLPFVVVLGMLLTVLAGQDLTGFVGFEPFIQALVVRGGLHVAETAIGEHQRVVRHQILGIDGENVLQGVDGVSVVPLQELNSADLVQHDPILRVLYPGGLQVAQGGRVVARFLVDQGHEEMGSWEVRCQREGARQYLPSRRQIAFRDRDAAEIDPAVRIVRLEFGDALEGAAGSDQIALTPMP